MVAQQTLTLFVWVQILVPLPTASENRGCNIEVWLSLVERYVRDVEAGGSNPLTSTMKRHPVGCLFCFFTFAGLKEEREAGDLQRLLLSYKNEKKVLTWSLLQTL